MKAMSSKLRAIRQKPNKLKHEVQKLFRLRLDDVSCVSSIRLFSLSMMIKSLPQQRFSV